jgi:hypothetical protein
LEFIILISNWKLTMLAINIEDYSHIPPSWFSFFPSFLIWSQGGGDPTLPDYIHEIYSSDIEVSVTSFGEEYFGMGIESNWTAIQGLWSNTGPPSLCQSSWEVMLMLMLMPLAWAQEFYCPSVVLSSLQ